MATEPPHEGKFTAGGYSIACTMPDQLLRHNISDEELDVLCDPPRDDMRELKWAAFGALFSSIPGAADALLGYSPTEPVGRLALFQIVVLFVSAAVWLVLQFAVRRRTRTAHDKRTEIRARTRRIEEGAAGAAQ